jgi:hypothetical protein
MNAFDLQPKGLNVDRTKRLAVMVAIAVRYRPS